MTDASTSTAARPGPGRTCSAIPAASPPCSSPRCGSASPTTACARILVLFLVGARRPGRAGHRDSTASAIYGLYISGTHLPARAVRRLDRGPAHRRAARGVVGRHPHHGRQRAARARRTAAVLPRPRGHRLRRGPAQAEHQRASSRSSIPKAARAATPASPSSTWASTSARSSAPLVVPWLAECVRLARRLRRCRRSAWLLGAGAVRVDAPLPRRGRHRAGRSQAERARLARVARGHRDHSALVAVVVALAGIRVDPASSRCAARRLVLGDALLRGAAISSTCCSSPGSTRPERKRALVMIALFVACADVLGGLRADRRLASTCSPTATPTAASSAGRCLPACCRRQSVLHHHLLAGVRLRCGSRSASATSTCRRRRNSALGLIFMGVGFLVMYFASQYVVAGEKVLPTWLILTYLFHTGRAVPVAGGPVAPCRSSRRRASSARRWACGSSPRRIGNNLAGQLAGEFDWQQRRSRLPHQFLYVFWCGVIGGGVMLLITPLIKQLMAWREMSAAIAKLRQPALSTGLPRCGRGALAGRLLAATPAHAPRHAGDRCRKARTSSSRASTRSSTRSTLEISAAGLDAGHLHHGGHAAAERARQRPLPRLPQPVRLEESKRYDGQKLSPGHARALHQVLRLNVAAPAPRRSGQARASMTQLHGAAREPCTARASTAPKGRPEACRNLDQLSEVLAKSRNYDELVEAWKGWHDVGRADARGLQRVRGARERRRARARLQGPRRHVARRLRHAAGSSSMRSRERLWQQVKPLYDAAALPRARAAREEIRRGQGAGRQADSGAAARQHVGAAVEQDLRRPAEALPGRQHRERGRACSRRRSGMRCA